MLSPKCQSAQISKITYDGLTPSDTGCFIIAAPVLTTVEIKGLNWMGRVWTHASQRLACLI